MKLSYTTHKARPVAILIIIAILYQAVGCNYQYYSYRSFRDKKERKIKQLKLSERIFYLHQQDKVFRFSEIRVDQQSLSGKCTSIYRQAPLHSAFRTEKVKPGEERIFQEVHIYISNTVTLKVNERASIPFKEIGLLQIMEGHKPGKTLKTVGYVSAAIVGFFVLIIIIALLTKSSCPYVYAEGEDGFVFEGETFGGAIGPNIARNDYMPLPSAIAKNGKYRVRISNELKERQYTDLANLICINHPKHTEALLYSNGKVAILKKKQTASQAASYAQACLLAPLSKRDQSVYMFNDSDSSKNGIIAEFTVPKNAEHAKLIINARNTLWFDYIYGEFMKMFGNKYNKWDDTQKQLTAEKRMKQGEERHFPLSVYVKIKNEWVLVEKIPTVGPMAFRDFVIPVDIEKHNMHTVEVKLETGFMFWEIDRLAIDYNADGNYAKTCYSPLVTASTDGVDWTQALLAKDGVYMAQAETGDIAEMEFKVAKPDSGFIQSVFLQTYGYYEMQREFKGAPQVAKLMKFKNPEYFSEFSKQEYLKIIEMNAELATIAEPLK